MKQNERFQYHPLFVFMFLALVCAFNLHETALAAAREEDVLRDRVATAFSAAKVLHKSGEPNHGDIEARTSEEIRIALLLPLSGANASTGQAMLDASTMALFEAHDPRLRLLPYDTRGTPEGAEQAMRNALNARAEIVLGPVYAEEIKQAAPLARAARIPVIGFSNSAAVAGEGVYLLSFLPDQEVQRILTFAVARGLKTFGALIPKTPYGDEVRSSFVRTVPQLQGEITKLEIFERQNDSLSEPVKRLANYDVRRQAYLDKIKSLQPLRNDADVAKILKSLKTKETLGEAPFDAVLVAEGGQMLRSLIPLLPYYEIDPAEVQYLGTQLWYDPTLPGEPTLIGSWYAGADPKPIEAFMSQFGSLYGYRPPRNATLAYDGIALVGVLAKTETRRLRFVQTTLENQSGFLGVDGLFRLLPNGTNERALAVIQISREDFKVIEAPALAFDQSP